MRYAKALMGYAHSTGTEDRFYEEFRMLSRSLERHPELRVALDNPVLAKRDKYALICAAALGDVPAGREFSRFITLLLKNGRAGLLQYISLTFLHLYRNSKHIGVAKLTTAVPVSREMETRITQTASSVLHARIELQTEVDPSIEGGFIFDINDSRLDASIATQLKRVKKQFIDKNRRIV